MYLPNLFLNINNLFPWWNPLWTRPQRQEEDPHFNSKWRPTPAARQIHKQTQTYTRGNHWNQTHSAKCSCNATQKADKSKGSSSVDIRTFLRSKKGLKTHIYVVFNSGKV